MAGSGGSSDSQVLAIEGDKQTYPYSQDISSHTTPTAAVASSEDTAVTAITQSSSNNSVLLYGLSGSISRRAIKIANASSALKGKKLKAFTCYLLKVGAPTGNITINVRDSSDTIISTLGTIDAATLTTSEAAYTLSNLNVLLQDGYRISIEYTGGNGTNYVSPRHQSTNVYDSTNTTVSSYFVSTSTWTDYSSEDLKFSLDYATYSDAFSIDNSTSTKFKSQSVMNPNIYVDMASAVEMSQVAIYHDSDTTCTGLEIAVSTDAVAWTLVRTVLVSALTAAAYNYIRFNRPSAAQRYLRIRGNDGTAKILSIGEIKVLSPTPALYDARHGHRDISNSSTTISLSGT